MLRPSLFTALSALALLVSTGASAHAEHDKARYVATNGADQGNCNNPVRPCKSISYAVSKASKGDKVLVAGGEYTITSESELFYLKSELVPVLGGFNRIEHFQVQSPEVNVTTIVGAPVELRQKLHQSGFKVIADKKGGTISEQLRSRLTRNQALSKFQNNQSCQNGRAGSFSCQNVDLVAHVPLPGNASGNDIWGHVDLNSGTEYALMGFSDGTRVYSLADPSSPTLVGYVAGNRTSWRDIKVYQYFDENLDAYQAYAYVTAEASNGVQIIDLNNLPLSISLSKADFTVNTAHNVYISNLDYGLNIPNSSLSPKMQIVGADKYGGAFASFDLSAPANPTKSFDVGSANRANYTHDATSLVLDDDRAQRDCVNSINGRCDVFIDFNEDEIRVWDTTNTANSTRLGQVGYNDVPKSNQYVHSGWWHENKRYVYVQDEADENSGGLNTTVRIIDLADLNNPTIVGKWQSDNRTIDHNGFVKGNRYYMSNYERGLTILDISDPVNPVEVGYFDTFPSSDNASFNGAWGTYPYLPSGNILISDINSGLYVVKDTGREALASAGFSETAATVERGQTINVQVTKPIGVNSEASVYFELLSGSAKIDSDVSLVNPSNKLTWSAQDSSPKSIELNVLSNGKELAQNFFVRLHNASPNLQIDDQYIAQINIAGLASTGKVSFVQPSLSVSESSGETTVSLQRVGGSRGPITVDYQANFGTATEADVEFTNGTLTWAEGDTANKTFTFTLVDDEAIEQAENFTVKLINADAQLLGADTLTVTINDNDSNAAPEVYAGNDIDLATNATTTLSAATATDSDGDEITLQWQQVSGVTLTLSNTTSLNLTVAASDQAGSATLRLTATDVHGESTSDDMVVSVVAPPPPTPTQPESSGSSGGSNSIYFLLGCALLALRRIKF